MKNSIYLVTGAAGFLGSNVCRQLTARGERVRALIMNGDPAEKYVPKGVEIIHGDLLDEASLEVFFDTGKADAVYVIHCASIVWVKNEVNPKVHAVNVDGTANILAQCVKHRVAKLIYISSTGAIPERPHGEKIREVDRFLPTDGLVDYYSKTKAEATQLVLDALKEHPELDASIVHPSGICGPYDYAFGSVTSMVRDFLQGKMKMGIEGTFNSVDVRDLAAGVIAACEKGRRGECYIMSNEIVTMRDMFRLMNASAGLSYRSFVLSREFAHVGVRILGLASKFTGKDPLLSEFNIYMLNRNNEYDCSKAERELGFHCRPFSESIRDTVAWLREEDFLNAA
jgi:dihydroflavonol-4-reductase